MGSVRVNRIAAEKHLEQVLFIRLSVLRRYQQHMLDTGMDLVSRIPNQPSE
jgi:hypothetical protein